MLFNEDETVLLQAYPPYERKNVQSQERHILEGVGTTILRRTLNRTVT